MDVSEFSGYKIPTPVKGRVMLEVLDAEEVEGKRPNDEGEKSRGLKLTVAIKDPPDALMSDGTTAVGYTFSQSWWLPRAQLVREKPQTAGRMKRDFARLLDAVFGVEHPATIQVEEWIGRQFFADIYSKFDDYNKEDICEISNVVTPDDMSR